MPATTTPPAPNELIELFTPKLVSALREGTPKVHFAPNIETAISEAERPDLKPADA